VEGGMGRCWSDDVCEGMTMHRAWGGLVVPRWASGAILLPKKNGYRRGRRCLVGVTTSALTRGAGSPCSRAHKPTRTYASLRLCVSARAVLFELVSFFFLHPHPR
jgi:hypothetical protein